MSIKGIDRIHELDILRTFAIVGVILIHVVSGALYTVDRNSLSFKGYIFIDQLFRFSVPLFVALSGYTLALKYKDAAFEWAEFFKKRLLRILPWYFLWSAVIFVYLKFILVEHGQPFPLWKVIFLGKADYHLYFVPMIFQLYLLFPLILFLYRKLKLGLIGFLFISQAVFYYVLTLYSLKAISLPFFQNDQQQYLFFGTWIFYFVLGIFLSDLSRYKREGVSLLRLISWPVMVFGFLWTVYACFQFITGSGDLVAATRSTRIPVLIYASGFILVSILFGEKLLGLSKFLVFMLCDIGKRSYVIYLLHTLVIRVFTQYVQVTSWRAIILLAVLTIVVSDYLAHLSIWSTKIFKVMPLFSLQRGVSRV